MLQPSWNQKQAILLGLEHGVALAEGDRIGFGACFLGAGLLLLWNKLVGKIDVCADLAPNFYPILSSLWRLN
jgi:hypothetical protein